LKNLDMLNFLGLRRPPTSQGEAYELLPLSNIGNDIPPMGKPCVIRFSHRRFPDLDFPIGGGRLPGRCLQCLQIFLNLSKLGSLLAVVNFFCKC